MGRWNARRARRSLPTCPAPTQEATLRFLEQIAQSDSGAEHIILQDGAGFHFRPSDLRLPAQVHVITLPAYSPELNPTEKVWDLLRDVLCNQTPSTLTALRRQLRPELEAFWSSPARVLKLIGGNWLSQSVNAISPGFIPAFN